MTGEAPTSARQPAPAMHIGQVAIRTELSLRTLRHYDEVGLVRPSGRSEGGFRLYTEPDVEKLFLIRRMKPLGFSLDEMRQALQDIETLHRCTREGKAAAQARERLADLFHQATERRAGLVRQLAMADEFMDLLGHELAQ